MNEPAISIVIPTRARPEKLRTCLQGIARLDHGRGEKEVIVVDDNGGQPSLESLVSQFRSSFALQLIECYYVGPGAVRNAGTASARGHYLAFIDDDCVPAPNWLSVLWAESKRRPGSLLGGCVVNGLPDNPYSTASQLIATYVYNYYRQGGREMFFTANNLWLEAERFHELGGFNTSIPSRTAEDKEFCDRWRARGYLMAAVPDAVVYHSHDLTLPRFLKQHYNYGRGILVFRLLRKRRRASNLIPEPLSFYRNLIFAPTRDPTVRRKWYCLLLLVLSQIAAAVGALKASLFDRSTRTRRLSSRCSCSRLTSSALLRATLLHELGATVVGADNPGDGVWSSAAQPAVVEPEESLVSMALR